MVEIFNDNSTMERR